MKIWVLGLMRFKVEWMDQGRFYPDILEEMPQLHKSTIHSVHEYVILYFVLCRIQRLLSRAIACWNLFFFQFLYCINSCLWWIKMNILP